MSYQSFIENKRHHYGDHGFAPRSLPDCLFDFQRHLVEWACRRGRAALFADCGLGKTLMELVWAQNVVEHTNRPVLVLTPLAVAQQTVREGEKFGVQCTRSTDGSVTGDIVVTNYERLGKFKPEDFAGIVCDESSILKNFKGTRRGEITEFARNMTYRLTATATPAPNDWIELGTTSEAIGELGHMDMLSRFFKNDQNTNHPNRNWSGGGKWRFRGHAERDFWRWLASWARALRKPSDIGDFDDSRHVLPPIEQTEHVVRTAKPAPGMLFALPAQDMREEREELRRTVPERCEYVAEIANKAAEPIVTWCHLNSESELLRSLIQDAEEIRGSTSDDRKEELLEAFASGQLRVLVTKPSIAGFGLNWQHCGLHTFFPSHSYEQYHQCISRSHRFGRTDPVRIKVISTEGQSGVLRNLKEKSERAARLFERMVAHMNDELNIQQDDKYTKKEEVPAWL